LDIDLIPSDLDDDEDDAMTSDPVMAVNSGGAA
jgi:hypothetical protein